MGIQGLARRLEPYSRRYTVAELQGYTAVVDGPSLAYEAHKLALSTAANQTRIPSYADINREAIQWLEALESQGINITRIVPGEADDSCAALAKDAPRSIVFTSDTDLLVFDYLPETLVVLFQDSASTGALKAYSPHEIAEKMRLKTLIPFAYAVQQRSSEAMDDLVRDARNLDIDSSIYQDFNRRYTAAIVTPGYIQQHTGLAHAVQNLDVRTFEFMHEALIRSSNLPVYLPLLVEDPNQASAWTMARDIRTLAYSLLVSPKVIVREHTRKAQGISSQDISLYTIGDLQVPARELEVRISGALIWAEAKDITPQLLWTLFALSLVLAELSSPPSLSVISRVINGEFDNTWAFLQLAARLQAALYSLRMLKQITSVWLAISQGTPSNLRDVLSKLHTQMATLPAIASIFTVPGQAKKVLAEHEQLKDLLEEIFSSVGVEVAAEQVPNKKKKRQAREAERKKRNVEQRYQLKLH
ncbi:hypothetical protein ACEQ8H_006365 [Pleosporales sp. CAS-2024a]